MSRLLAGLILAGVVLPAIADTRDPNIYDPNGFTYPAGTAINWDDANSPDTSGQINLSGATLFQSFFQVGASSIDAIDVDNDGIFGYQGALSDQLARNWSCGGTLTTHWVIQYRGTGSGNGLGEFVDFQLLGKIPDNFASDNSLINRTLYADGGAAITVSGCAADDANTNSPFKQNSVDFGIMDVPTTWFVTYAGAPNWNRKPGQPGYGLSDPNTIEANGSALKSLERTDPNGQPVSLIAGGAVGPDTIVDTPLAWVPIAVIANHGVGIESMSVSELRYYFLTGRGQNGLNLLVGTRDAGSGTRNGFNNSLGIDPSWGRGDNRDPKWKDNPSGYVGPNSKWTNSNSSSRLEDATENKRLLIAYTGLMDDSKAADHFDEGAVEIVDVIFDNLGGTAPVRPSIENVVVNGDPNNGYTIGGPETLAHRGTYQPGDPFMMANGAAAAYVRNIAGSIQNYVSNPGDPDDFGTPGQKLASNFILQDALDSAPLDDPNLGVDPEHFVPNTTQVAALKQDTLDYTTFYPGSGQTLAAYGSRFETGLGYAPRRVPGIYTDGAYASEEYNDAWGGLVTDGSGLPTANEIQGDFDFNGVRDLNDLVGMLACIPPLAVLDPNDALSAAPFIAAQNTWALAQTGKTDNLGHTIGASNPVIPAIIGDLNADGNFDKEDVRLFADGLYVDGDCVNRGAAFTQVDTVFGGNFFGTVIASGAPYAAGDSRADVAGSGNANPGAEPLGQDGVIDMTDIDYIKANYGDWSDLDRAILMDLSCDMNGDCVVDGADVAEVYCIMGALGDMNCSGAVDAFDIDPFVTALLNPAQYQLAYPTCDVLQADINKSGNVDAFDIDPFVSLVLGGSCK